MFPASVTIIAFLFLYRYVPSVSHGFRDVWPGAVIAGVLFEGAKHAFTYYVANWNRYEMLYGALGAVMLFLLWIYLSAMILLIGAELASAYEELVYRRRGERLASWAAQHARVAPRPRLHDPTLSRGRPARRNPTSTRHTP